MTVDTTSSNGFWQLNSPLPYLFVGLALLLGLIAVAFVVLSCSHKHPSADLATDDEKDKPPKLMHTDPNTAPRIVVMAGDDNPKYLAKPMASAPHTEQV
ncbi:Protein glutamine dumper 4 [Vitis vinifera]|uniref:Protein glutamine dumper 4 n=1 Tax=Vitis vinifera TaxID=29760 RepID=A0A438EAU3_VITVI|nr:Protein glutamine dumper 4 [Vitis vinifera]